MSHWIDLIPKQEFNKINTLMGIVYAPVNMEFPRIKIAFHNDEFWIVRYQNEILGIERRLDALMKRRNTNN